MYVRHQRDNDREIGFWNRGLLESLGLRLCFATLVIEVQSKRVRAQCSDLDQEYIQVPKTLFSR